MWFREAYHNFFNVLKIDIESPNKELIERKTTQKLTHLEPRSQKQIRHS
jgi:hypothetical protein